MEITVFGFSNGRHPSGFEEFRAELLGVRRKFFGKLVAEDLRESDDVVEVFGVEQLPARKPALQHRGAQHGASGVERGSHPRRTGSYYNDVVVTCFRQTNHPLESTIRTHSRNITSASSGLAASGAYVAPAVHDDGFARYIIRAEEVQGRLRD